MFMSNRSYDLHNQISLEVAILRSCKNCRSSFVKKPKAVHFHISVGSNKSFTFMFQVLRIDL